MLRVVAETYPDTVWAKLATAKLAKPEEKQVAMIDPVQPLNVEPVVKLKPKSATSKPLTGKAKTLRAAADNGDVNAMFELGGMFFKGKGAPKDKAEAAFWFAKVAEAGDARGMNRLGDIYLTGEGVERDWTQSAAWYRKSADMGDAAGIGKLAGSYLNGEGVDKDEVEAMRLYRQAAEAGNIDAMYNLEAFLREGIGGQKDPGEAAQWVKRIRAAEAKKQ